LPASSLLLVGLGVSVEVCCQEVGG